MAEPPMRRLSDKVLAAFDQACDMGDAEIAEMLLRALELILTKQGGADSDDKRSDLGAVMEAYGRLLTIKNRV
jgi:hypothetical protein